MLWKQDDRKGHTKNNVEDAGRRTKESNKIN
jgi:hypothetical protein